MARLHSTAAPLIQQPFPLFSSPSNPFGCGFKRNIKKLLFIWVCLQSLHRNHINFVHRNGGEKAPETAIVKPPYIIAFKLHAENALTFKSLILHSISFRTYIFRRRILFQSDSVYFSTRFQSVFDVRFVHFLIRTVFRRLLQLSYCRNY